MVGTMYFVEFSRDSRDMAAAFGVRASITLMVVVQYEDHDHRSETGDLTLFQTDRTQLFLSAVKRKGTRPLLGLKGGPNPSAKVDPAFRDVQNQSSTMTS